MSTNCPLLNIGRTDQSQRCQKEVCEFWDDYYGRCCMVTYNARKNATELKQLRTILNEMLGKMKVM